MCEPLSPTLAVRRTFGYVLAAVWLAALPADGAAFRALDDGELADGAALIVSGRIVEREALPGRRPEIGYRLAVDAVVKGDAPADLLVRLPGGVRDGLALAILGVPRFAPGDEVLLFLRRGGDGTWTLSHLLLGAFEITAAEDGKIATREADAWTRRDLDRFLAWLGERARHRPRPPDYLLPGGQDRGRPEAAKFERVVSSTDPPPFGCGAHGGHAVRWFDFDPGEGTGGVRWRMHARGQQGLPDGGAAALRNALDAWTRDPHSRVDLAWQGRTDADGGLTASDGVNALLFDDPDDVIPGTVAETGILAVGGPWFRCEPVEHGGELFHPIVEADIVTNQGLAGFLAAGPSPRRVAEEIFAHELGHTLGFAHSGDPEALMAADAHADGRGAALDVDDLAGLLALYGDAELEPPAAPSDLTVAELSATSVRLTWSDNSSDESNFRIERRSGGGFVPLAAVAADRGSFVDAGVAPETEYRYRVRAQNGAGASAYSLEATAVTPADLRPAAPSNLRAAPLSSTRIRLGWQDNSDDERSFALLIFDPRSSEFVEIPYALPADTTSVLISELDPDTAYTFKVRARNGDGASPLSNAATAATFAADAACVVDARGLCLLGGRFRVELDFVDPATGAERAATAMPATDQTGLFWFFDADNVELIVKMLDGRAVNERFWVFYGGISDLEFRLTVTDTASGDVVTYENARGELCGRADIEAFDGGGAGASAGGPGPAPDPGRIVVQPLPATAGGTVGPGLAAGVCEPGLSRPGPDQLCLLDGRLRVEVRWRNPWDGSEGVGQGVYGSDNSGDFWFFDPQNLELVFKALDGTPVNGHLWIFYGALTDLEYWLTVTDTVTGASRVYRNPPGRICGQADTLAFESGSGG